MYVRLHTESFDMGRRTSEILAYNVRYRTEHTLYEADTRLQQQSRNRRDVDVEQAQFGT